MKKADLERLFKRNGWIFERNGGNHDVWTKGNQTEAIPRHREINEALAKAPIKKHNLK